MPNALRWLPYLIGTGAMAALGAWVLAARFDRRVRSAEAEVRSIPPGEGSEADLPPLLHAYVARAVPNGGPTAGWVQIEQTGEMRLDPEGDWKAFRASQVIGVPMPRFVWAARFRAFRVVDRLSDHSGLLEARLFGVVPIAKSSTPATTRAQLLRYLAEIVWAPHAIATNPFLTWEQTGPRQVVGSLTCAGETVELRFHFDRNGDVASVEGMREREVGHDQVLTPWVGRYSNYETLGGIRVPTRAEVQWTLDSGAFLYWRGRVVSLRLG